MRDRLILDTNVIVRLLTGEPADQSEAASQLFDRAEKGEIELVLMPVVVAETIFVLTSFYQKGRDDVAASMLALFESAGVECAERPNLEIALRHFQRSPKAHWVDCYLAGLSETEGEAVASFDRDFDKLKGSRRLDPKKQSKPN